MEAIVALSLLAWAPVFESFQQVLGPRVYAKLYPDWRRQQAEVVESICGDTAITVTWVAEVDGVVTGFIAYQLNAADKSGVGELLAVHPDYQNHGIGTDLNTFALTKMQESGMEIAWVGTGGDPGHAPARRSYEKAGYTDLPIARYFKAL
ncbi:MAG TPA: GNAT family N-acetyltransferase [Chloroflexia bacterium]|nr:GNAT family N-acetyltransferase [Chloroflexia bacterium]